MCTSADPTHRVPFGYDMLRKRFVSVDTRAGLVIHFARRDEGSREKPLGSVIAPAGVSGGFSFVRLFPRKMLYCRGVP